MSVQIFALDKVSENELIETVKKASDDDPNFVTAINDREGAFSVKSTFISDDGAAASGATITLNGKMSHFGGPNDHGVKPDEDLAIMDRADVANNSELFLATQPAGTTGTARRLNPDAKYIACRWDYNVTPKTFLKMITVKVSANEKTFDARPVDWGPNVKTGRIADLSPGLESELGLTTDQQCQVENPDARRRFRACCRRPGRRPGHPTHVRQQHLSARHDAHPCRHDSDGQGDLLGHEFDRPQRGRPNLAAPRRQPDPTSCSAIPSSYR